MVEALAAVFLVWHKSCLVWRCRDEGRGPQKLSLVLQPQTGAGERRWSPAWFAFRDVHKCRGGQGWSRFGSWEGGGLTKSPRGLCQVTVFMYCKRTFLCFPDSLKHSTCLPPAVGIPRHVCDRASLSEECFVRSQDSPHIRGIRLAPVR